MKIDYLNVMEKNNLSDTLFKLGLSCSVRANSVSDLIDAHKWFNIAVLKGSQEALHYRKEIARELSVGEIAKAQRAAREWLRTH